MLDFFEYSDLVTSMNKWVKAYATGSPVVSDKVYDEEYKKLKQFELANPNLIDKNSPTVRVNDGNVDGFQKVAHEVPMLSIANSNSLEELRTFSNDKSKKGCSEQVVEFKIDGLACSLIYEGDLQDSVTRGNGEEGDRVYANVLQINAIPKKISVKEKTEIRGEVVWLKDDFNAWNKKLKDLGEKPMGNPRNGAAGTLKLKDPQEVAERKLSFVAYSVVRGSKNTKHSDDLEWLKKEGFIVSKYYTCNNSDEVIDTAKLMEKERHTLPFLIDGLVIKVNDKTAYKRLGGTVKTPFYCTALKFPPEEKESKLIDIEHSYGRTGAVTPVAIIEEIELALTNVSRISLHNWDIVSYMGLHKGCKIVIRKAGEIIPEIVKVSDIAGRSKDDYEKFISSGGNLKKACNELHNKYNFDWYQRPQKCAHCNSVLEHDKNNSGELLVSWICANPACSIKQFKNICKFVSKEAMDISGVSESVIEKLLSKGYIKNITDLYKVTKDQLLTLENFADRSSDKFLAAVNASRNNYMHQFLAGVGIPNLGKTAAKILSEHFNDLETFHQAQKPELENIPGIGPELAENIITFRKDGGNRYLFRWFIDNGICTKSKPVKKTSDKLKDIVLIMSGTATGILERDEFKKLVLENGGKLVSSVSKNLDYFVKGEKCGPEKIKKVDQINATFNNKIKIITPEDFLRMIK